MIIEIKIPPSVVKRTKQQAAATSSCGAKKHAKTSPRRLTVAQEWTTKLGRCDYDAKLIIKVKMIVLAV
jgi:hypothetical protein